MDGLDVESIEGVNPLGGVRSLSGVRVYDVGQGDSIAILDGDGNPVFQVDYGGRQGHPFGALKPLELDIRMPVAAGSMLMMTHWDEDHWSSAPKGTAAQKAKWLVPRQVTSPRAVRFAAELEDIHCIPEDGVGKLFRFTAANGDAIRWEKLAASRSDVTKREDCNRTGVALSVVRTTDQGSEVILLPGDAAFGHVRHYHQLRDAGATLTGIVAFHHGSGCHWTRTTERLIGNWPGTAGPPEVVVSCADKNSYGHPDRAKYAKVLPGLTLNETSAARARGDGFLEIKLRL